MPAAPLICFNRPKRALKDTKFFKGETKMKKMFALVLALVLCLSASAMAETVLQLGTTVNEQDSFQVCAEKFAELVAERTNGEYKIEI